MAAAALCRLPGLLGGGSAAVWRQALRSPHSVGCRRKSTKYLVRPGQPKLAYSKTKGRNPGVIFLPGFASTMMANKAIAIEKYCKSLGHSFIRFDYTGCGASGGKFGESTIGQWKNDVLAVLDELTEGPQVVVGSSMGGWLMLLAAVARPDKIAALVGISTGADYLVNAFKQLPLEVQKEIKTNGEWYIPNSHKDAGFYKIPYTFIKDAENYCLLHGAIPVTCPVRLIHGLKDEHIPWQISLKVAEVVISKDVDIILCKNSEHRMSDKDDIKLIVNLIDDLIDKLTKLA